MTTKATQQTLIERGEKLLSFTRAAEQCGIPGHRGRDSINASTLWRWRVRGVMTPAGKIFLECDKIGSGWRTSVQAIHRFVAAMTAASLPDDSGAPEVPAPRRSTSGSSQALDAILG